ncbi:aldehyde ferredoxin oxidoreductase family protein [Nitrospinota bacterium]
MFGYQGKILYVDLSERTSRVEEFDEVFARKYLGGNGFAARILWDQIGPATDPLSPESAVVLAVGPYTDTPVPSASRACVAAKSPLTGLFCDGSFGGAWPVTLKRTGHDAIVLTGRADAPIYLFVGEEGAAFREAGDLWGKTTQESCEMISDREEGADVLAIGPAGENLVLISALVHTWRKSRDGIRGRGGIAAVFGSKNLKGIAVRGKAKTALADPGALRDFLNSVSEEFRKSTATLRKYGTSASINMINKFGGLGTRNLQAETFPEVEPITGEYTVEHFFAKSTSCYKCSVACGNDLEMKGGTWDGLLGKMPEYETLFALGSMLGVNDFGAILKGNQVCDELGLDTISAGVTLALAFECFEKGLITESEVGFPLRWGDGEAMVRLLEETAHRRGFGARLAEGGQRLAESIGEEAVKMLYAAKKLEIPAHSARALKGMAIGYATGTRGGSHHDTRPAAEYSGLYDNRTTEGKPELAVRSQNCTAVGDSLSQCRFTLERGFGALMINEKLAGMLNHVTGWDTTVEELEETGARICNLERAFQVREGVDRSADTLPHRAMHEPIPEGPNKGMYCPPEELERMKDEYYALRGWDDRGIPTAETLGRLSLDDLIEEVARGGYGTSR